MAVDCCRRPLLHRGARGCVDAGGSLALEFDFCRLVRTPNQNTHTHTHTRMYMSHFFAVVLWPDRGRDADSSGMRLRGKKTINIYCAVCEGVGGRCSNRISVYTAS